MSGPGGTGDRVRITGFERWRIGSDDLIASSEAISTQSSIGANWKKESDRRKRKMRTAFLLVLIPAAFVATSCGPAVNGDNRAANASAIQALDEQWSATAARNDLDGTIAFYADDAVLLPPNAPIATDRNSIRESWSALLGGSTAVSWKVSKVEVAKSGELGYLYGTYSLSIRNPNGGPPVRDTGKLVEIWKKQEDGKWKCIVDTYNSDLPAASAPEAKK